MLLQSKTNTPYRLDIKLLISLIKPKSILSLILSLPLTIFKYRKVINKKPYLYYTLTNLNIPLYPLAYITAQAPFKAILITPYRTTLTTSALYIQTIYLFIAITVRNNITCGYIVTCCRGTSVARSLKLLALPHPLSQNQSRTINIILSTNRSYVISPCETNIN